MKERHLFRLSAAMEYKKPKLEFEERQPLGPNEKFALIEIVRSFPEIWDEHNPAFKDSARKTQLWHMVRREMEGVHSREFQGEEGILYFSPGFSFDLSIMVFQISNCSGRGRTFEIPTVGSERKYRSSWLAAQEALLPRA